jgi:hypothetical protein
MPSSIRAVTVLCAGVLGSALTVAPGAARAQAGPTDGPVAATSAPQAPDPGPIASYFQHWFDRVRAAQESQPSWMTPLVTVTPRLEQELRYDQYWEHLPNGGSLDNYGTGKGLELIPTTTNELIIGPPAYETKVVKGKTETGWADGPTILLKQRLFSENAASGDRIVTAFLAVSGSAGGRHFTQHTSVITPTLAAGQGFGVFDIQATTGVAIPVARLADVGAQWQTNVAFQAHLAEYFWPEFEVNDTVWLEGTQRGGKNQVFLTPGIIFGRFRFGGRAKGIVGVGYQVAVSPSRQLEPELLPTYNHNWILSARLAF